MMKEFSCGVCHRLFDHHPSEEEHHCEGHVQKYAVSRFQEFLLRSALKPLAADSSSSGGGGENQESSQVSVARSLVDSSVNEAEAVTQPSSRKRAHSECEDGEADQLSSKAFCAAGDANECSDPINKDDESLACSASSNQTQTVSKSTDGATARGLDDDVPDAAATVACSRGTSPEIGVHRGGGLNLTSAAGADVGRTAQDNYSIAAATDMLVESERNTSRQTEDVDGPVAGDVCSAQRCESRTDVSDSQLLSANNGEHDVDPVLNGFDQLIFLDIDNWSKFFYRMPGSLPEKTFVWGFYGGTTTWKEPTE